MKVPGGAYCGGFGVTFLMTIGMEDGNPCVCNAIATGDESAGEIELTHCGRFGGSQFDSSCRALTVLEYERTDDKLTVCRTDSGECAELL